MSHSGGSVIWACMTANGTMFTDNVTSDRSIRMNPEMYKVIFSAHIQPNAEKLVGSCLKMHNDPNHTAKTILRFFKAK